MVGRAKPRALMAAPGTRSSRRRATTIGDIHQVSWHRKLVELNCQALAISLYQTLPTPKKACFPRLQRQSIQVQVVLPSGYRLCSYSSIQARSEPSAQPEQASVLFPIASDDGVDSLANGLLRYFCTFRLIEWNNRGTQCLALPATAGRS